MNVKTGTTERTGRKIGAFFVAFGGAGDLAAGDRARGARGRASSH
jgi:hypothetical protein